MQFVADQAIQRTDERAANLCYELNRYLTMLGKYVSAQFYCERALTICKDLFGPDTLPTARIMNGLGVVLLFQGKHGEARSLFEDALALEQAQVQDESGIEPELDQLATLLGLPHNIDPDQPLRRRALSLREHIREPQHPLHGRIQTMLQQIEIHIDIAKALDNLGIILDQQGQYSEAQPRYERAIALRELLLGPEHPHTIRTQTNLAVCYHIQKRYDKAEPLYQRVLSMSKRIRGSEHPDTATNYQNLGELYAEQDDNASARPLYEDALRIREKVLGDDHLDTAYTLHHFGCCLRTLGETQQAAKYLRRAITIRTKQLGQDHPDTLASVRELQTIDPQYTHE